MPRYNPNNYDSKNVTSYAVVKPGVYLVKVADVSVQISQNNNEYWKVRYEIVEQGNEFYGSSLFDNITFSPKTYDRVNLIFEAFGVDLSSGERDFEPEEIIGGYAKVQVSHVEDYKKNDGTTGQKSVIGFDGYFPAEASEKKQAKASEEEIPF